MVHPSVMDDASGEWVLLPKALEIGDVVVARGCLIPSNSGYRLEVPPDIEGGHWIGLDFGGDDVPSELELMVVDVIGEWLPDERVRVHDLCEVDEDEESLAPGRDIETWWPPGDSAPLPADVAELLDVRGDELDVHWAQFCEADDGTGLVCVGTSKPDDVRRALVGFPVEVVAYPQRCTRAIHDQASKLMLELCDDEMGVAFGGAIAEGGHLVSIIEPVFNTPELLKRIRAVPEGCLLSFPWIAAVSRE